MVRYSCVERRRAHFQYLQNMEKNVVRHTGKIRVRGIGVGAQSTLGGKTFLTENICMKN